MSLSLQLCLICWLFWNFSWFFFQILVILNSVLFLIHSLSLSFISWNISYSFPISKVFVNPIQLPFCCFPLWFLIILIWAAIFCLLKDHAFWNFICWTSLRPKVKVHSSRGLHLLLWVPRDTTVLGSLCEVLSVYISSVNLHVKAVWELSCDHEFSIFHFHLPH